MNYIAEGAADVDLSDDRCFELVDGMIAQLDQSRPLRRVLLLPPDYTRSHSGAGPLTCHLYRQLATRADVVILPALGTHVPMSAAERTMMFPGVPGHHFRDHDWRDGVATLGEIPASEMMELSEGKIDLSVQVQVDRLVVEEPWDAVISIGQLVPHEVIGIANQVKNVLVGAGGFDVINKSHWLGAVYGMERIMGRAWSPVRELLTRAAHRFLSHVPITYLMTVRARDAAGRLVTRGLFAGDDDATYRQGADLCRAANLDLLDHAPKKAVVSLDPAEFKSTWLGNKAIYRTRMAMADDGELVVLAPGVERFGEDPAIDKLIRRFGYRGTPATLQAVKDHPEMASNLSAAAHLIHGSTEGRFRVTYCPGHLSRDDIENVGYSYADLSITAARYAPGRLKDGWNQVNGEEVFYVSNPALGLWGTRDRFGG